MLNTTGPLPNSNAHIYRSNNIEDHTEVSRHWAAVCLGEFTTTKRIQNKENGFLLRKTTIYCASFKILQNVSSRRDLCTPACYKLTNKSRIFGQAGESDGVGNFHHLLLLKASHLNTNSLKYDESKQLGAWMLKSSVYLRRQLKNEHHLHSGRVKMYPTAAMVIVYLYILSSDFLRYSADVRRKLRLKASLASAGCSWIIVITNLGWKGVRFQNVYLIPGWVYSPISFLSLWKCAVVLGDCFNVLKFLFSVQLIFY